MKATDITAYRGPTCHENWKAFQQGVSPSMAFECPLFSDTHFTGEIRGGLCGPYELINLVSTRDPGVIRPRIILRYAYCLSFRPEEIDFKKTDVARYHGAALSQEIAALFALSLGVRLKAGSDTRIFVEGDPKGLPITHDCSEDPILMMSPKERRVLPDALVTHKCLNHADLISSLPDMTGPQAVAVIRSARLYQDALWLAEAAPELAWLMLVSAVETAANHWRKEQDSPRVRLKTSRPDLDELLVERGGEALAEKVAGMIAPYIGSTKKFLDFCMTFMPDPPTPRPPEYQQHPWDEVELKQSLKVVYKWRSRALHGGIPFPRPMCEPPPGTPGIHAEKPQGGMWPILGAVWVARDTPMFLRTFEYIVRNVLLGWWKAMHNENKQQADSPGPSNAPANLAQ